MRRRFVNSRRWLDSPNNTGVTTSGNDQRTLAARRARESREFINNKKQEQINHIRSMNIPIKNKNQGIYLLNICHKYVNPNVWKFWPGIMVEQFAIPKTPSEKTDFRDALLEEGMQPRQVNFIIQHSLKKN
jgi:hypothetical protein